MTVETKALLASEKAKRANETLDALRFPEVESKYIDDLGGWAFLMTWISHVKRGSAVMCPGGTVTAREVRFRLRYLLTHGLVPS